MAAVTARTGKTKLAAFQSLAGEYTRRTSQFSKLEIHYSTSEDALLAWMTARRSRSMPFVVLLDSRGKQLSSEELAQFLQSHQGQGTQEVIFAIGPADGWSEAARKKSGLLLSFGKMTLPHELAKIVLLEQLYRGFAILNRHPYHSGH